ncbi:PAS domain-containing protein [Flectobacillus longus]|uniref:PAS domain-containing protein n=1 Tax=Flectobacillus longus TaxID=2984207 RepID=UPI0024B6DBD3|nr:PAS domain-containing protein [Flectobacillus longus]MDI9878152.1 PAS domain-containing protein [Flectobacillus longus]
MLNFSEEPSLFVSPSHEIISYNAHLETMIKWFNPQSLQKGQLITAYKLPVKSEKYHQLFEEIISGKKVDTTVPSLTQASTIQYRIKGQALYSSQGIIQGALFSFNHIGHPSALSDEIANLKHYFESIIAEAHEGILFLQDDLSVLYYNEAILKQSVYENIHLLKQGNNILDIVSEKDKEQTEFLLKLALSGKMIDREVPISGINGQTHWFRIKLFPIKNQRDKMIGIAILSLDVSQKKKLELALHESEIRFKNIIENTPIALAVLDKNFQVIQLNSVAEELLGYTSQELIGTDLRSIIYCSYFDDRESSPFFENSDAFFTNLTSERFISTINKAGELVTVDITINAYRFNTNKTIVIAARDVRVLLKQEEKLQLHSELFRKIAWQQSHEVRKPLANIMGITNLLLESGSSSSMNMYLEYLKEATVELDIIIKNIVDQTYLTQGE